MKVLLGLITILSNMIIIRIGYSNVPLLIFMLAIWNATLLNFKKGVCENV